MTERNRAILESANAAISRGDIDGFLDHCAEDIVWSTMGEFSLNGKQAVRRWMESEYGEPPRFVVEEMVEQGDWVVALGTIEAKDPAGSSATYAYSDVWRFRDGKMVELRAFLAKSLAGA